MSSRKRFLILSLAVMTLVLLAVVPGKVDAADSSWTARYFNNKSLSGTPVVERSEPEINWDWGYHAPLPGVRQDGFSVRWTRTVDIATAGNYRFTATMDDGMRVWLDDVLIIDSWKDGAVRTLTADRYLGRGDHRLKIEYYDNAFNGYARFSWAPVAPATINNWRGEYFNNVNLSGSPVLLRDDANVDFNWSDGVPVSGLDRDNFSVRWTRNVVLEPGRYRFTARVDDGVRLWVNDRLIIDRWAAQTVQSHTGEIELYGGPAAIRMEYFERNGYAEAHLNWTRLTNPPTGGGGVGTATVSGSYYLNVRRGPGLNHTVITQVHRGNVLSLVGYRNAQSNWVMVALPNGTQGWVNAGYVQTTIPVSALTVWAEQSGAPGQPGAVTATVSTAYLNVRVGPGINHNVLTVISRGTGLTLTHRNAAGNWVRVILPGGSQGWVNATYLQSSAPITGLPIGS